MIFTDAHDKLNNFLLPQYIVCKLRITKAYKSGVATFGLNFKASLINHHGPLQSQHDPGSTTVKNDLIKPFIVDLTITIHHVGWLLNRTF